VALKGVLTDVEPEIPLAALLVDTVTVATVLGEDRLHLSLKVGAAGGRRRRRF
jgi:hypothetical protein